MPGRDLRLRAESRADFLRAQGPVRADQTYGRPRFSILHETMHHFVGNRGIRRGARRGARRGLDDMGHPESPHWRITRAPEGFAPSRRVTEGRSWSVWTGRELLVWNEHRLARFSSRERDLGNPRFTERVGRGAAAWFFSPGQRLDWRQALVSPPARRQGRVLPIRISISGKKAERDASELLLCGEARAKVVPPAARSFLAGRMAFCVLSRVSGAFARENMLLFDGWPRVSRRLLDAPRDGGRTLLPAEHLARSARGGRRFPGVGRFRRRVPLGDGAVYHAGEKKWQPIAKRDAPSPRFGPAAVWTGGDARVRRIEYLGRDRAGDGARFSPHPRRRRGLRSGDGPVAADKVRGPRSGRRARVHRLDRTGNDRQRRAPARALQSLFDSSDETADSQLPRKLPGPRCL